MSEVVVAVATGATVFVVVVVVAVVDFDFVGGARAWMRQAPWYLPFGEAMCVMCCDFRACVHASLYVFCQKPLDIYVIYLCPKRVKKLRLYENQRQHV